MAREERIFATKTDPADRPLDGIGVDLDAAIIEVAQQASPMVQTVADGLGDLTGPGHGWQGCLEPGLHRIHDRLRPFLACGMPRLGRLATDVGLDLIEQLDARQRLGCDRCRAADIDLVEFAPQMRLIWGTG